MTKVDACNNVLRHYHSRSAAIAVANVAGALRSSEAVKPHGTRGYHMREITVICADPVETRLGDLAVRLRVEGIKVIHAESAARCLVLAARYQPVAVVLDSDLLRVDHENMAEYVTRLSASTAVFLTVEDPSDWAGQIEYVQAVVKRGAAEVIATLIRGGRR
jgi:hypothetical protein